MTTIKQALSARYLLFPKIQLKYAFIFSGIFFVTIVVMICGQYYMLSRAEQYNLSQDNLNLVNMSLVYFNLVILVMSCLVCFILSILITHRFLGPTIGIKRALEAYKNDNTFKRINVRKSDEVQDLVETLNIFLKEIEMKTKGTSDEK